MPIDEDIVTRVSGITGFGPGRDIFAFYQKLVDEAPAGSRICEVGNYHGRGLAYLALAAKKADKGLKILGADWGRGQAGFPLDGHALADAVLGNLYRLGVADAVTLLLNRSHLAADWVADGSLWAVFVDDDHEEGPVRLSMGAWYPKVMSGGIFSGHDYCWPGPNKVVNELWPSHSVFEFEGTRDVFYLTKE